jgi:hypothetical protein
MKVHLAALIESYGRGHTTSPTSGPKYLAAFSSTADLIAAKEVALAVETADANARKHERRVVAATWALVFATIGLIVATLLLAAITWYSRYFGPEACAGGHSARLNKTPATKDGISVPVSPKHSRALFQIQKELPLILTHLGRTWSKLLGRRGLSLLGSAVQSPSLSLELLRRPSCLW